MTAPAWLRTVKAGDRVVCIKRVRDVAVPGQVYVIKRFHEHSRMASQHGTYDIGFLLVGDPTTVYDPRSFRPLDRRPTDITVFTDMLNKQPEMA